MLLYTNHHKNFADKMKIILTKISPAFSLKKIYIILAGSQSIQYQSILGNVTLGLEVGASDQTGGEIPDFPIFKSS